MASTNHAQRIWPALNTKATNTTTVLQPQSRLLSLVPELRTKIFEYAVEESNPIVVIFIAQNFKTTSGKKRIRYSLRPAHPLLVVSEQTRSEAQIFYWTQDTFLFNDLGLNYKTIETFNYITMIDKYLSKVAVSRTVRVPMLTQTGVTSILIFPLHFLKLQLIRENNAFSITPMSDKAFLPLIDSTVTTGAAPCLCNLRSYLDSIAGLPLVVAFGKLVAHMNELARQQSRVVWGQNYWCGICSGVTALY